jgi:mRNA interferase HicA
MRRRELERKINKAARVAGLEWRRVESKGNHDKWRLGTTVQVSIPRHGEVNEITAASVLKATERELGASWWN